MGRVKREQIEVYRPPGFDLSIELRSGAGVRAPYPRHWHDEYQLCLIDDGSGELVYRGCAHVTPATSFFVVHPGEVHSNETYAEGCSFRSLYLAPEWMARTAGELGSRAHTLPFFPTTMIDDPELIRRFCLLQAAMSARSADLEGESLLIELLAKLIARHSEAHSTLRAVFDDGRKDRTAVDRAREYLEAHFADHVRLETLAALAGLSPFHLNRLFRAELGLPPHAYQMQLRVGAARRLLREGMPIARVAVETGFVDQSHLTRHFRRLMLIPPGQYLSGRKNVQDSRLASN